ncbi:MAG TPA: VOC family protein [Polyangiaceae bacterium]|nr:VOC family protein [Polyangiaceae bacterium]
MSSPFVWFHHNGDSPSKTRTLLESLIGARASEGPGGLTMLATQNQPFAALGSQRDRYGDRDEWIPFVAVSDVESATAQALSLGATLVRAKSPGPAGEFSVIRDPGGAALGLWKKAEQVGSCR